MPHCSRHTYSSPPHWVDSNQLEDFSAFCFTHYRIHYQTSSAERCSRLILWWLKLSRVFDTIMSFKYRVCLIFWKWPIIYLSLFFLSHTGLNSRSPLSETKSTSSSLSALSDSLNSSEGGDVAQGNEELKSLLAPPSSAGSQSSSGPGTEEKAEKGEAFIYYSFFFFKY